uniref:Uncharacterized protein n=1 Tax=viral metagenome TaxID=1070528 RepID=A0A6C0I7B0_9ZZZZ
MEQCFLEQELAELEKIKENKFINEESEEQKEEVCIYEPCQYNYLWYTSWLFLTSTFYSIYQAKYAFAIWPGGIFITSLNYWKKPRYNTWERTLDVGYVYSSIAYNFFRGVGCQNSYKFYLYFWIAFVCYLLSNYNHRQKRLYISALLHSMVHLFGNISTIYLYSGEIHDAWDNPITQRFFLICENLVD